ncbi:uncharacterized protein I206_103814 [Kwoniella pini CBS 10737]|uniref:Uncharacterized protein n=1 Tax=Kwoniella pini CBS 10737 TaxID=1296096 RepID=A0AAJ8MND6_9TREE
MSPTRKRRHQSSSPSSSQPLPKRFTRSSLNQNQHQETSDTTYPSTAKDKSTPTRKTIKKDSDHSISRGEGSTARMTSSQPIIIDDFDDEGIYFADSDGDLELDDDIQAAITASLRDQQKSDAPPAYSAVKAIELPSPALTDEIRIGRSGWKKDFLTAKDKWTGVGSLEGYAGMLGSITGLRYGDADDSIAFSLSYDDIDGREFKIDIEMAFQELNTYPASYKSIMFSTSALPKRAETTFS